MTDEERVEPTADDLDSGPEVNGDLASWLYVLCGIPAMIVFFVVLFMLVGTCDRANIMLHG